MQLRQWQLQARQLQQWLLQTLQLQNWQLQPLQLQSWRLQVRQLQSRQLRAMQPEKWPKKEVEGGGGCRAEPLFSNHPPLQAGLDFPECSLPESPPLVPQCHQGNRGKVGGVYTPVTFAGPACPSASSGCAWMALEEEEACTRRCIAELYAALLELLLQDFWVEGLLSAPPPLCAMLCPQVGLSVYALTLPQVARPVRRLGGQFFLPLPPPTEGSVGSTEGWGYTHPPHSPAPYTHTPCPPDPGPRDRGWGGEATASIEGRRTIGRGTTHHWWKWGGPAGCDSRRPLIQQRGTLSGPSRAVPPACLCAPGSMLGGGGSQSPPPRAAENGTAG